MFVVEIRSVCSSDVVDMCFSNITVLRNSFLKQLPVALV